MNTVRIASLNIQHTNNDWPTRRHTIIEELSKLNADIIALQETAYLVRQSHWIQQKLNEASADYYGIVHQNRGLLSGGKGGVAILSRLPILSTDSYRFRYDGRVAIRANIELKPNWGIDIISTHLDHHPGGTEVRRSQFVQLLGWINSKSPEERQVIAGTLSASNNPVIPTLAKQHQYRSAFECQHGRQQLATYPTMTIPEKQSTGKTRDYLLLSPQLQQHVQTGTFCTSPCYSHRELYPSDHIGIYADLHLNYS